MKLQILVIDQNQNLVYKDELKVDYYKPFVEAFRQSVSLGNTSEKMLALTFDGGSSANHTSQILSMLKENEVTCTMFLTGKFMEQNHSLITILLAVLIASFVTGFFRAFPIMFIDISNIQFYSTYYPIFMLINIIIHPFLIFILFYKIGKRFDLKLNLKPSIIRLVIGSYLGHFVVINLIYLNVVRGDYFAALVGSLFSPLFLETFFVSFSALAIAYLRNNIKETEQA